ncbi:MAG: Fic family protein [Rhabdochlamydiaceae bacterium]
MVAIKEKRVGDKTYYYLGHTFRAGGKVRYTELYLGTKIPKGIERMKSRFLFEIYKAKWYSKFEAIRSRFGKVQKSSPPEAVEKHIESFMVKFTYNTQRIEGSTLNLRETAVLLLDGITPKNKPLRDVKEAEAHKTVFYEMLGFKKDLSLNVVLEWHYELFKGTRPNIAGKIRSQQVAIAGSGFMPPSPVEVQPLLREFFRWYDSNKAKLNPVELAALAHLKFVTIHPFTDGNGRISRLLMNFVLNKHGYPMLNISYSNRNSYYTALERSHLKRIDGPFLQWFFRRYIENNKEYLK